MKRMLVNATQQEELRVALVDGQKLYDLSIELPSREQKKALQEGQDIVVQVEKEERGNKGAALTTYISLAGRFLVLMPNNPRAGGVSRRIEGEDRDQMRDIMDALVIPSGMGAIVRTAGVGRAVEELQWDLDNLKIQWDEIVKAVLSRPAPFLVYRESDPVTRALRDYFSEDIGEVLVDEPNAHGIAAEYMQRFMPAEGGRRLKMYTDDIPLFTRYQIESQIESAYAHKVQLPSGGSIVIDYTEALVSIDINSARATRGGDIETTATNTNLEAADEIARQLRIRDIGGLIVIDFIDMEEGRNQRAVEDRLRDAMKADRARIQIGRLSRFGLLEMSRQRLRPSLSDSSHEVCPRCQGIGSIRTVESMALAILRLVGEEARKDRTAKVIAEVPVDVATYLINEKREWLRTLEDKSDVELIVVPNLNIDTPEYSIRRVRDDEAELPEQKKLSYQLPTPAKVPDPAGTREKQAGQEPAAVPTFEPRGPRAGIFVRIWRWLFGDPQPPAHDEPAARNPQDRDRQDRGRGRGGRDRSDRERHREGRGGDRGRDRGDRGERSDRPDRDRSERSARRGDRDRDRGDRDGNKSAGSSGAPGAAAGSAPTTSGSAAPAGSSQGGAARQGSPEGSRRSRDEGRRGDRDRPAAMAAAAGTAGAAVTDGETGSNAASTGGDGVPLSTGDAASTTQSEGREGGARRGRRRGRRGRRGGQGRDAGPNEGNADVMNDMDDGAGDEANAGENPGTPNLAAADSVAAETTASSSAQTMPSAADFVVPPPPNETRISWTGLAATEPAPQPDPTPQAEEPAAIAAPDPAEPAAAQPVAEAAAPTGEPAVAEPVAAQPAVAAPAAEPPPAEKKVVWSSAPTSYGSSSYGSRRDDY
ncbi:MAG: Rne/Rng family ribonuclease [Gammaproteobacteria bacterium]|nr:Rne/Rng family ribonuclease [Gammaproteobacteria bacterium]